MQRVEAEARARAEGLAQALADTRREAADACAAAHRSANEARAAVNTTLSAVAASLAARPTPAAEAPPTLPSSEEQQQQRSALAALSTAQAHWEAALRALEERVRGLEGAMGSVAQAAAVAEALDAKASKAACAAALAKKVSLSRLPELLRQARAEGGEAAGRRGCTGSGGCCASAPALAAAAAWEARLREVEAQCRALAAAVEGGGGASAGAREEDALGNAVIQAMETTSEELARLRRDVERLGSSSRAASSSESLPAARQAAAAAAREAVAGAVAEAAASARAATEAAARAVAAADAAAAGAAASARAQNAAQPALLLPASPLQSALQLHPTLPASLPTSPFSSAGSVRLEVDCTREDVAGLAVVVAELCSALGVGEEGAAAAWTAGAAVAAARTGSAHPAPGSSPRPSLRQELLQLSSRLALMEAALPVAGAGRGASP